MNGASCHEQDLDELLQVIGSPCNYSEDCNNTYSFNNDSAIFWDCLPPNNESSSTDGSCILDSCESHLDCDDQACYNISHCDEDDEYYVQSTICLDWNICNNTKTLSNNQTVCNFLYIMYIFIRYVLVFKFSVIQGQMECNIHL